MISYRNTSCMYVGVLVRYVYIPISAVKQLIRMTHTGAERNIRNQGGLVWNVLTPLMSMSVIGQLPSQRQVTRSFGVFFDLRLNKRMSKLSKRRRFETASRSLWRHCYVILKGVKAPAPRMIQYIRICAQVSWTLCIYFVCIVCNVKKNHTGYLSPFLFLVYFWDMIADIFQFTLRYTLMNSRVIADV